MKIQSVFLCLTVAALLLMPAALCEQAPVDEIVSDEDWSWNPGSYNSFSGTVDLSPCDGETFTLHISTDLPENSPAGETLMPVFTVVNGKRITMLNQSDTVQAVSKGEESMIRFSGSIGLPEKDRVRRIAFRLTVLDAAGQEVKAFSSIVSIRDDDTDRLAGSFYIPFRIERVTLILSAAAVLIWMFAVVRCRTCGKKHKMGEQ